MEPTDPAMSRPRTAGEASPNYRQYAPCPRLARYVACFWTLTGELEAARPRIRVVPDGCMDLILDLSGELAPRGVLPATRPTSFVTGATLDPMIVRLPRRPRVAAARFRPGGARVLLGLPADLVAGSRLDLADLMPAFGALALSLAGEAASPEDMVAVLARLLRERLDTARTGAGLIGPALGLLARPGPPGRVARVASELGLGQKRLEAAFRRESGLTPKEMARTLRFIAALRALRADPGRSLADLALWLGHADQAHFNREFRRLAGITPTAWLVETKNVDFVQYLPERLA